jgi:selenoprotein W-related protein
LIAELEESVSEIRIVPSGGGVFEVVVDGELVSSKRATGKHAELDDIVALVRARSGT